MVNRVKSCRELSSSTRPWHKSTTIEFLCKGYFPRAGLIIPVKVVGSTLYPARCIVVSSGMQG
jgi:hypothetical protein